MDLGREKDMGPGWILVPTVIWSEVFIGLSPRYWSQRLIGYKVDLVKIANLLVPSEAWSQMHIRPKFGLLDFTAEPCREYFVVISSQMIFW